MQPTCRAEFEQARCQCAVRGRQPWACGVEPSGDTGTAPAHLPWSARALPRPEGKTGAQRCHSAALGEQLLLGFPGAASSCTHHDTLLSGRFAKGKAAGKSQ